MDVSNLGGAKDPFGDLDELDKALEADKPKKKSSKKKEDEELGGDSGALIHIRVQQRNGRKCITTVQGLDAALDLKKILKALKKAECCNGSACQPMRARAHELWRAPGRWWSPAVQRLLRAPFSYPGHLSRGVFSLSLSLSLLRAAVVEDEEMGNILQLQGDQRDAVGKFLTENEIVEAKKIKKHGAG